MGTSAKDANMGSITSANDANMGSITSANDANMDSITSANGAKYESQGQAPNNVRRVAPGSEHNDNKALKERNN